MRNRILLTVMLIVAIASIAFIQSRPAYEYKFDFGTSEKKANELGAQGWELIAIQSTGPGLGNNVPTYVFRRMK